MKEKIFNEMMMIGWNLRDNEIEDFEEVYQYHKDKMDYMLDKNVDDTPRIEQGNWTAYIGRDDLQYMFEFMFDFLECLDRLDRREKLLKEKEEV